MLRRNVDLQILLFNNRIYGLTKGQYSPTSRVGQVSPSTPLGSVDTPVLPAAIALGAGGRFVARAYDTAQKRLPALLRRAHDHRGASFVELLQNCPVYNDGAFEAVTDRKRAAVEQLWVENGQPLRFGAKGEQGLRIKPGRLELEVVTVGENGVRDEDILVHDETNRPLAFLLAQLETPTVFGVLYCEDAPAYDAAVHAQLEQAVAARGAGDLAALLASGHTWTVSGGDAE